VKTADGGLKRAENSIRIIDLFRMTAGFNYDLRSPSLNRLRKETEGVSSTRDFARYHACEPLECESGTLWQYSLAHDVIASLVEVVADEEFNAFCKKNIFDVAGMTETTYLPSPELIEKISGQFRYNAETREMVEIGKDASYRIGSEYESGGAGIVSTVDDYIKFTEALRTGKLISQESITEMTKDQLTPEQSSTRNDPNYGYGLGFRAPIGEGVTDFGWGGAAGAYIAIDREREISIFYAQHVLMSPNGAMRYKIAGLVKECLGYTSASTPEACYPCATLA
jgi:CubicO group peptidase (beta-lactamase class C family)